MRKLVAALFVAFTGIGAAQAAPDALKCAEKFDPLKPASMNCFADEIFILNGAETVNVTENMVTTARPLVDCAPKGAGKDSKNCVLGSIPAALSIEGLKLAADKAVELIKAKSPQVPEWDEIVIFNADFGPTAQPAPLFFRTGTATGSINPVGGIGLPVVGRDPAQPYVGIINAGNTKTIPPNPASGPFGPCGAAPRPGANPTAQEVPALCAPGLYTYFDSLSQATANIYGPYLGINPMDAPRSASTMPLIKTALVAAGMGGVPQAKIAGGPATNVWNAFLNTRGSLLGGNTFADNGNGTWSITRPPAFQGVSAPYESAQVLRFQPMDLYVLGFAPLAAVPPIQSFMGAQPANVYQPAGVTSFNSGVGPFMGSRLSGVSVRGTGTGDTAIPRMVNFADLAAGAGERSPGFDQAPQHIKQLWIMVTKPEAVIDAAVVDGGKKEDQVKDQVTQLTNLQRYRRSFSQYFYTMTGYKGRVYTTFEGDQDDVAYWEFGGARDDAKAFQAQGSLKMQLNGPEEIPNSGGKQLTVLRVTETNGADGLIKFNRATHPIRIVGAQSNPATGPQPIGSAPNNVLSIRMRVPPNPQLLADLKKDSSGEKGFYATFVFQGGGKMFAVNLPELEAGFLVPDGKFRTYAVNLSNKKDFTDGVWDSFTFIPSNRPATNIEIESIRVGWIDAPKDADKSCTDTDQPDGWLDNVEDNCPKLYNPDQADGNSDGVGDACEDYDGDNKLNVCDNCPTTTNTSQRDANGNKIGDACDGSSDNGCFFQESTVAGAATPTSALFGATLVVFGVLVAGAVRRRRRR